MVLLLISGASLAMVPNLMKKIPTRQRVKAKGEGFKLTGNG